MNDRMINGELEMFAYVGVETHYIAVLYSLLTLFDFVVKTHGLVSNPVRSISSVQRHVSDYGMRPQIVGNSFELTSPLYFDSIASTLQLLDSSHRLFVPFGQPLSIRQRLHFSERLALATVIVTSQEFINGSSLGTVTVHSVMWQFWRSKFSSVSCVLYVATVCPFHMQEPH